MSRARTTDTADFDGFYQAHYGDTVAMTFSYTADLAEAQDIAQEAFSRAWQRWNVVSRYDNPLSWVRRVATNLAHSRWRRVKVATAYLIRQRTEDLPELSPDSVDVVAALKRLPVPQRKAIVLHYLMDLPINEVAEELGAPAGTVKSWLHRGRASLSAELGDEVRRNITPEPAGQLRKKAEKQQRNRRTAIVATSFIVAMALLLGAASLRGKGRTPEPPATPTPSPQTDLMPAPDGLPWNCRATPLPIPADFPDFHELQAADSTARVLTGKVKKDNQTHLIIWKDGQMMEEFEMPGGNVDLYDVNSSGVAVGTTLDSPGGDVVATAWRFDGKLSKLNGTNAFAYGINNAGTIVGAVQNKPAVWRPGKPTPEYLSMPAGEKYGTAFAVTEAGLIVGQVGKAPFDAMLNSGRVRSYVWYPDGSRRELAAPTENSQEVRVTDAAGTWAVGTAFFGDVGFGSVDLRWNLKTGESELIDGYAEKTNAQGWIARNEKIHSRTANTMIPSEPGGHSGDGVKVRFMSDDGKFLAGELNYAGVGRLVTWRCDATAGGNR